MTRDRGFVSPILSFVYFETMQRRLIMFRLMSISDMERLQREIGKLRRIVRVIQPSETRFHVGSGAGKGIDEACDSIESIIGEIYGKI